MRGFAFSMLLLYSISLLSLVIAVLLLSSSELASRRVDMLETVRTVKVVDVETPRICWQGEVDDVR